MSAQRTEGQAADRDALLETGAVRGGGRNTARPLTPGDVVERIDRIASHVEHLICAVRWEQFAGDETVAALQAAGRARNLIDALWAAAACRAEDIAVHTCTQDRDTVAMVSRLVGVPTAEARRAIATVRRLDRLPALRDALRRGAVPAGHAAMISDVASDHPEAELRLLEAARRGVAYLREACVVARAEVEDEPARERRQHSARALRMWSDVDGMLEGRFRLPPVQGGRLKALIEAQVRRIIRRERVGAPFEAMPAYAADALCELLFGDTPADDSAAGGATGRHRVTTTMHLVIDFDALVRGRAIPGERCEIPGVGPVNVVEARRLLGDAFLTAVVRKGRDIRTVAHLGRHIPAELRTALIVAGWECVVEGCGARWSLEIDHSEIDHGAGGPTAWGNLTPLCPKHHRRKTAGARLGPPDPVTGKRRLLPAPNARRRRAEARRE